MCKATALDRQNTHAMPTLNPRIEPSVGILKHLASWCLQNFWNRLASKYGTKKYWQERGEEASIVNAVCSSEHAWASAIVHALHQALFRLSVTFCDVEMDAQGSCLLDC